MVSRTLMSFVHKLRWETTLSVKVKYLEQTASCGILHFIKHPRNIGIQAIMNNDIMNYYIISYRRLSSLHPNQIAITDGDAYDVASPIFIIYPHYEYAYFSATQGDPEKYLADDVYAMNRMFRGRKCLELRSRASHTEITSLHCSNRVNVLYNGKIYCYGGAHGVLRVIYRADEPGYYISEEWS